MNVVNKGEVCTIKDMNRINNRGNHCPFGDPSAASLIKVQVSEGGRLFYPSL